MINPICEVRVDTVIDKRRTKRGIAVALLVHYKDCHYACDVFIEEFPAGFLTNLLMGEEISSIKMTGRLNGKKFIRFRALAWTYQPDQLKAKLFGTILNAIGSDIESIAWRDGESLAVGESHDQAKRLEELLKRDIEEIEPGEEYDF